MPPGVDEDGINTLVGITGKPRDQCIRALQIARGNADLACSLLFEGVDLNQIPADGGMQDQDYGDEDPMAGGMPGGMPGMGGMPGGGVPNELMALMGNP